MRRYKCMGCGRSKFYRKWQPHRCIGGFRKHRFFEFVEVTDDNGMKYTKEYIAKVRLCSNLIDPPASDVIGELLDEIEQLTAERDGWRDRNTRQEQELDKLLTERDELLFQLQTKVEDDKTELWKQINQLTAERNELQEKLDKRLYQLYMIDLAKTQNELDEWRADAERLAKAFYWDELGCVCIHCWEYAELNGKYIPHKVDCPITLHRELVAKYGGENNQANVCSGGENNGS